MNGADIKGRNVVVREDNGPSRRREDGEEGEGEGAAAPAAEGDKAE